jgi:16S rRNA (cytidine1402-2'-O)-methyltransferase
MEGMKEQGKTRGTLYIVATPIGNLEDITLRALRVLKEVDLIAAEDTRRTRQLLTHYGIHKPLISYHEHNWKMREEPLMEKLRGGVQVALVTDAGTPGISDPGEHLVRRAAEESIVLVPIPGPAAVIAALSASGLSTAAFIFYGFLPAKTAQRQRLLQALADRPETLIFYESPKRLTFLLEDVRQILGDRRVVVARELTKVYEEMLRGTVSEVLRDVSGRGAKGEVTVIIEGGRPDVPGEQISIRDALESCMREFNLSLKEAVSRVAGELNVPRRDVYKESLAIKKNPPAPSSEEGG